MARKKRGRSTVKYQKGYWYKRRVVIYGVSMFLGLIGLFLQLFIFNNINPVWQNVLNWTVGIGLVGGFIGLLADTIARKYFF